MKNTALSIIKNQLCNGNIELYEAILIGKIPHDRNIHQCHFNSAIKLASESQSYSLNGERHVSLSHLKDKLSKDIGRKDASRIINNIHELKYSLKSYLSRYEYIDLLNNCLKDKSILKNKTIGDVHNLLHVSFNNACKDNNISRVKHFLKGRYPKLGGFNVACEHGNSEAVFAILESGQYVTGKAVRLAKQSPNKALYNALNKKWKQDYSLFYRLING